MMIYDLLLNFIHLRSLSICLTFVSMSKCFEYFSQYDLYPSTIKFSTAHLLILKQLLNLSIKVHKDLLSALSLLEHS